MYTVYICLHATVDTLGSLESSTVIIITSSATRMTHPAGIKSEWFVQEV